MHEVKLDIDQLSTEVAENFTKLLESIDYLSIALQLQISINPCESSKYYAGAILEGIEIVQMQCDAIAKVFSLFPLSEFVLPQSEKEKRRSDANSRN